MNPTDFIVSSTRGIQEQELTGLEPVRCLMRRPDRKCTPRRTACKSTATSLLAVNKDGLLHGTNPGGDAGDSAPVHGATYRPMPYIRDTTIAASHS